MSFRHLSAAFAFVLLASSAAHANLDIFLDNLNVTARGNIGDFRTQVGAWVGASSSDLEFALRSANSPGDAALCLWLSRHSGRPLDAVMDEYRANHGRGWGAMAKNLGIKPGSRAFKDLKQGRLGWHPASAAGKGHKGAKNKREKGRGHGNGRF